MKVCFFSPTAYAYFNPDAATWAGGAETQQVLVGRYLAEKGVAVSFIVGDYGQRDVEVKDGIQLIKSFALFKGNRKLRFIPDMFSIRRAMRIADADVYNQRSTAFYTGQLAWFASRLGRVFTFSVGSDYNVYRDCGGNIPAPVAVLYRWGIRRADAVIAQTERQQRLMRENFARDVLLIRNGIPIPAAAASAETDEPPHFLWVGGLRWMKRAEMLVEVARRLPEVPFTLIGGKVGNERYYRSIVQSLRGVSNIRHIEFVPPEKIIDHYRRAYALINTSAFEGFPNTFLHAWAHGVPVLTLEVDPDMTIARKGLGLVGGTVDGLVDAIRRILANRAERSEMGARALSYVKEYHDVGDRGEEYRLLFEKLSAGQRASRRRRKEP